MENSKNNFTDAHDVGGQSNAVDPERPPASTSQLDDLPSWLRQPDAASAARRTHPVAAWGGTLAATAMMVAFGIWLGSVADQGANAAAPQVAVPGPSVAQVIAAPPAAAAPPLVLLQEAPAAPAVQAVAAAPVRATPHKRVASYSKKSSAAPRKRSPVLLARAAGTPRATARSSASAQSRWSAKAAGPELPLPRMRCKRGELARECLARYR